MAYTSHDTSVALNMAGVKRFRAITLDTFAALFSRIGIVDQVREEVMEDVKASGRRILDVWRSQFQTTGVPRHLIEKVEMHQAELPLARNLRG